MAAHDACCFNGGERSCFRRADKEKKERWAYWLAILRLCLLAAADYIELGQ